MKKITTYMCMGLLAFAASCVSNNTATGEGDTIQTGPPDNIRTSSDMNITPAANTVPDGPEPVPADTSATFSPADKR